MNFASFLFRALCERESHTHISYDINNGTIKYIRVELCKKCSENRRPFFAIDAHGSMAGEGASARIVRGNYVRGSIVTKMAKSGEK